MTYNGLPLYDITEADEFEMTNISIVDDPAVESDFLKFAKEKQQPKLFQTADEQIILGVAIRADFPIYRNDSDGEYYVRFTRDAIKAIVKQYSKDGFFNQVSLQHNGKRVDGVVMVELYIKDTAKGINPQGFEGIEDGSLFVAYFVENTELWNDIKTSGELNGFSIEIYTTMTESEPTLEELISELLMDKKKSSRQPQTLTQR